MTRSPPAKTIPGYIRAAPKEGQKNLRAIYSILKSVAPKAKQGLKWNSPVFEEKRILFAFAAFRSHLNFAPTPAAMKAFKKELAGYKTGKGTISFPYDEPLPEALIRRIAAYRAKQVRERDARWM